MFDAILNESVVKDFLGKHQFDSLQPLLEFWVDETKDWALHQEADCLFIHALSKGILTTFQLSYRTTTNVTGWFLNDGRFIENKDEAPSKKDMQLALKEGFERAVSHKSAYYHITFHSQERGCFAAVERNMDRLHVRSGTYTFPLKVYPLPMQNLTDDVYNDTIDFAKSVTKGKSLDV